MTGKSQLSDYLKIVFLCQQLSMYQLLIFVDTDVTDGHVSMTTAEEDVTSPPQAGQIGPGKKRKKRDAPGHFGAGP